jgi:MazG family protein
VSEESKPYQPGLRAVFDVVHRLRQPDGCPWDREQTHESLRPYLLEETYEVLEAIDAGDDAKLREELGDLLLQVAMHTELASEEQRFDAHEVSEGVAAKMVARHPHVFGDVTVADAEEVLRNWERQKAREAGGERGEGGGGSDGAARQSVLERIPKALPALSWTLALQKRAARIGFDFRDAGSSTDAVAEEARELASASAPDQVFEELGDLLFSLVNLARKQKVNPEDALRVAGQRFARRFAVLEQEAQRQGLDLHAIDEQQLAAMWSAAKQDVSNSK